MLPWVNGKDMEIQENNHNTSQEKWRLIQIWLSLCFLLHTLYLFYILYIIGFVCVCNSPCFASKTVCVCVWEGGSVRPSLTPWSLISLLVRVMDDDGQARVCYVSLHTYSKKHSWCPTDSSTHTHKHTHTRTHTYAHTHVHTHTPSVIQ